MNLITITIGWNLPTVLGSIGVIGALTSFPLSFIGGAADAKGMLFGLIGGIWFGAFYFLANLIS